MSWNVPKTSNPYISISLNATGPCFDDLVLICSVCKYLQSTYHNLFDHWIFISNKEFRTHMAWFHMKLLLRNGFIQEHIANFELVRKNNTCAKWKNFLKVNTLHGMQYDSIIFKHSCDIGLNYWCWMIVYKSVQIVMNKWWNICCMSQINHFFFFSETTTNWSPLHIVQRGAQLKRQVACTGSVTYQGDSNPTKPSNG